MAAVGMVGCMATISTATASATITGAGSSLVAPLMGNWINGFEARMNGTVKVTYASVGSGTGIAQITARTVDFGASDAPLTPAQASACNGCVQIPWGLTATGLAFNIKGVKKLRLSGPVISGIYFGKITKWNDPKIKRLNPGTKLPGTTITPVFRSDGSGDTYAFSNYLSKVSKAWKSERGFATSVSFPAGVGAKGNSGVTSVVQTTNGAIGYISASYIIAAGMRAASIQNEAGNFELPEPEKHRKRGTDGQESTEQQRTPHRGSAEEIQNGVPDLDVHLLHRSPRSPAEDPALRIHPLRDDHRSEVRPGARLRAAAESGPQRG